MCVYDENVWKISNGFKIFFPLRSLTLHVHFWCSAISMAIFSIGQRICIRIGFTDNNRYDKPSNTQFSFVIAKFWSMHHTSITSWIIYHAEIIWILRLIIVFNPFPMMNSTIIANFYKHFQHFVKRYFKRKWFSVFLSIHLSILAWPSCIAIKCFSIHLLLNTCLEPIHRCGWIRARQKVEHCV